MSYSGGICFSDDLTLVYPTFSKICKKLCSLYVMSSGKVAFLHEVTIGTSEDIKKIWRHNWIWTNHLREQSFLLEMRNIFLTLIEKCKNRMKIREIWNLSHTQCRSRIIEEGLDGFYQKENNLPKNKEKRIIKSLNIKKR